MDFRVGQNLAKYGAFFNRFLYDFNRRIENFSKRKLITEKKLLSGVGFFFIKLSVEDDQKLQKTASTGNTKFR